MSNLRRCGTQIIARCVKMAEITSGDINGKKPSVSTGVKKKPKKSGKKK
jgi:hypothetical protein